MTSQLKVIKEGYIYIVRNSAMPYIVKIGKTMHRDIKERGLDASNVPSDFEVVCIKRVQNMDAVERAIHRACQSYRCRPDKEFFYECCLDMARDLLDILSIDNAGSTTPPAAYQGLPRKKKA